MPAPTGVPPASTSRCSAFDASSWPRARASTSCWGGWRQPSRPPTVHSCSPRPSVARTTAGRGGLDGSRVDEPDVFPAAPGPADVREPERLQRYEQAFASISPAVGAGVEGAASDEVVAAFAATVGLVEAYAYLSFARRTGRDDVAVSALHRLGERLPRPAPDAAGYLEPELTD